MGEPHQGMTGNWVQDKGGKGGIAPLQELLEDAGTQHLLQGQAAEAGRG